MPEYYLKEFVSQKVLLSNGKYFDRWERVGPDDGVLVTENAFIIAELEAIIRRQIGGVSRITAEKVAELQSKKNAPFKKQWREEFQPRKVSSDTAFSPPLKRLAEDAVAEKPRVPSPPPSGSEGQLRPSTSKKP